MPKQMVKIFGCAVMLISILALDRAGYGGDAGLVLPLERYTALSTNALGDVLPRLFYAGFKQVKGFPIEIVQTGNFPAARREGQSIKLNSVAVAAMDAAMEADYLSSSAGDGGETLGKYLIQMNDSAANFSGGDWQVWARTFPRFQEFYRSRNSRVLPEPSVPYEFIRQTILSSAIGSVIVRELTEEDFQSASIIARAGFDATPGTALVLYSALKNIQEKKGQSFEAIECNEAK